MISQIAHVIPFLHEIKTLIDWTFQNTYLAHSQWLYLSQIKHHFSIQEKPLSSISSFTKYTLKLVFVILSFCVFLAPCFLLSSYGIWLPTSYDIQVKTVLNLQVGSNHIELFQSHRHFWTQSVEKTQFDPNPLPSIFNEENADQVQAVYLSRYPDEIFKYSKLHLAPLISSIQNILQNNEETIQSINKTLPVIVSIQTSLTQTQTFFVYYYLSSKSLSNNKIDSRVFRIKKKTKYSLFNTTNKNQVQKNLEALLNIFNCQENELYLTNFHDPSIFLSQPQKVSEEGCQDIRLSLSCRYHPETSTYSYGSWSFETNNGEHSEPFFLTIVQLPLFYIKLVNEFFGLIHNLKTQILYIVILKFISMFLRSRFGNRNFQATHQISENFCEVYEKILIAREKKEYLKEIQEYENLKDIIKSNEKFNEKSNQKLKLG